MALLRFFDGFHCMTVPLKLKLENVVFDYIITDDSNEEHPNNERIDINTVENSINSSVFGDYDF